MRQTKLFTKTRKEAPADEASKNAELLIRGGFVNKEAAGLYDYLPFGLRVLKKIENIIREEMNNVGSQEIFMTSLQRPELWDKHFNNSRWNEDIWFKTQLSAGGEMGLAFTHEEPISNMLEQFVSSYKDLPFSVYQFQTKFRNELRAKSGIMRTREFIMKDMYSFSKSEEEHLEFYEKAKKAYKNVFNRVGLGHLTYLTFASGGSFAKYSHEFQTITSVGEDLIYLDEEKGIAINKEVLTDEVLNDLGLEREKLVENKAVEVGNIFSLGTKFSDPHLNFTDNEGKKQTVIMGSYGIGPGRILGTIAEVLSDDKGLIWPKEVAPFSVHLISAGADDDNVRAKSEEIYETLTSAGIEVLYDDRAVSAGEKFADADLIGIPLRVIVGKRSLEEGMVEIKERTAEKSRMIKPEDLMSEIKDYV